MEDAIKTFIGECRTFEAKCFDNPAYLARRIMHLFWEEYPDFDPSRDEELAQVQLDAIARLTGYTDGKDMVGAGIIGRDGTMTMTLKVTA